VPCMGCGAGAGGCNVPEVTLRGQGHMNRGGCSVVAVDDLTPSVAGDNEQDGWCW
jgi:hypothetical protein